MDAELFEGGGGEEAFGGFQMNNTAEQMTKYENY